MVDQMGTGKKRKNNEGKSKAKEATTDENVYMIVL